jgi:Domain of unknown function (DUF5069)
MDATLDGYAWLPRMIDKARAARAGTIGDFIYPCPIDRACLTGLRLDAATFADVASGLARDDAILAELRRLGMPRATDAWFDAIALEQTLHRGVDP